MKPASCLMSLVLGLAMALGVSADTEPVDVPRPFLILSVSVPGGTPATLAVEEGARAIYASEDLGISIGIMAQVRDAELGLVDLEVFEVELLHGETTAVTRGQSLGDLESLVGEEVFLAVNGLPVEIVVLEIGHDPYSSLGFSARQCQRTPPNQHLMPREPCCVESNGLVACGFTARTSSGSCCSSPEHAPQRE